YFSVRERPPTRAWLLVNYGSALVASAFSVIARTIQGPAADTVQDVWGVFFWIYVFTMVGLGTRHLVPLARGPWRPGGLFSARRPAIALLGFGLAFMIAMLTLTILGGWGSHRQLLSSLSAMIGVIFALPFAIRTFGAVLRGVLLSLGMIGATGLVLVLALE